MSRVSRYEKTICIVFAIMLLFVLCHLPHSNSFSSQEETEENQISLAQFTKSREQAIVDYLTALYDEKGYFHYSLSAPPYEGLLGLYPGLVDIYDGYLTLNTLDSINKIDLNESKDLLENLINTDVDSEFFGLINDSHSIGPNVAGLYTGLALFQGFGMMDLLDLELIANWVASCQQTDGGFSSNIEFTASRITYTYFAIELLSQFEYLDRINTDTCVSFVLDCINSDGGFGNSPSSESDSEITPLGLMVLETLGSKTEINETSILKFELDNWDNETGSNIEGSIVETERSLWSFSLLDSLNLINTEQAIEWILSCQSHQDGSFRMYPDDDSDRLEFCRAAVHSLELLNSLDSLIATFTVQVEPVWEIPQWYLDRISDLTDTTSENPGESFIIPDMTWLVNGLISIAPFSICLIPLLYYVYVDKQEKAERRQIKKRRKR